MSSVALGKLLSLSGFLIIERNIILTGLFHRVPNQIKALSVTKHLIHVQSKCQRNIYYRTSLAVQRFRIYLPIHGHAFEPYSRKIPHAAGKQSPRATTSEPALQSPLATIKTIRLQPVSAAREATMVRNACTTAREQLLHTTTTESPQASTETLYTPPK